MDYRNQQSKNIISLLISIIETAENSILRGYLSNFQRVHGVANCITISFKELKQPFAAVFMGQSVLYVAIIIVLHIH